MTGPPSRAIKANQGQSSAIKGQSRPIQCNQRPIKANQVQSKANQGQSRPIKANQGQSSVRNLLFLREREPLLHRLLHLLVVQVLGRQAAVTKVGA